MKRPDEKVVCETPTPGKQPTRIQRWKYELVRKLILDALPVDPPGLPFKTLARHIADQLDADQKKQLGSIGWYTTTVKLDLEVKGEITRVTGLPTQHLIRHQ